MVLIKYSGKYVKIYCNMKITFFSIMDECNTRYQNFRVTVTSHRRFIVFFPN